MKLSIITCTYNSEKYLQETINSVINQNLDNKIFEHIFVDGNSSDSTIKIIQSYQEINPNLNIQLIQKESKGIYNAMNEGMKIAKGEYLLFLHSDDYLEPNILNNYLQFIEQSGNLDLYYAKFNAVDDKGKFIYNAPLRKIYQQGLNKWILGLLCYINQPTVLHNKNTFKKYGLFNEKYKNSSDYEFYIKLSQDKCSSLFYDKTVTNFRFHNDSASTGNGNSIGSIENSKILNENYGIERYIYKLINKIYKLIKKPGNLN